MERLAAQRNGAAGDLSLWEAAWRTRQAWHPHTIAFARPTATLPVSLTGIGCALDCAHCGGHYLEHMRPIAGLNAGDAKSLLISGGCDTAGRVPVDGHLAELAALRPGRRLNWHVGFSDEATLRTIAPYVDAISFDLVGDRATAREVYGLDLGLGDYLRQLELLRRYAHVVPHITLGLRGGLLSGERAALEALAPLQIGALILNVLIPTPGTRYADCAPPDFDALTQILIDARLLLPQTRLMMGCMRPHGVYRQRLDEIAVRAGLNGLVNPTRAAERTAAELGLSVEWSDECCALP